MYYNGNNGKEIAKFSCTIVFAKGDQWKMAFMTR